MDIVQMTFNPGQWFILEAVSIKGDSHCATVQA
jgi:hypothetical protein